MFRSTALPLLIATSVATIVAAGPASAQGYYDRMVYGSSDGGYDVMPRTRLGRAERPLPPNLYRDPAYSADPYAPLDHVAALRKELNDAGVSFSITVYGDAEHGFTDPDALRHGRPGISYNAIAAKTSWAGTLALLDEVLA